MDKTESPGNVNDTLDLKNIQGDILAGLPKKTETYLFFKISDALLFKKQMALVVEQVKTVEGVVKDRVAISKHKEERLKGGRSLIPRFTTSFPYFSFEGLGKTRKLIPMVGFNISFSHSGLEALGIDDKNLLDDPFLKGQRANAETLGDPGTGTGDSFVPDWVDAFKNETIHGMLLLAGDSHESVSRKLKEILDLLGVGSTNQSITEVTRIVGDVRPGKLSAHEHFGYRDGISNPSIMGFQPDNIVGPAPVSQGIILVGRDGDENQTKRDPWMVDGSFLAFRYLFQRVPELDKFLEDNAIDMPGLTKEQGKDLLGARLFGRWKSGAPIDLTPFEDDPKLAEDPQRVNNFSYTAEGDVQKLCPFAAHLRKTDPRQGLENSNIDVEKRRILRRGVQFGPEVTQQEKDEQQTILDRGLLFVCYQSSIENGFQFVQTTWANNPKFPPIQNATVDPGFDPIIGQGKGRKMSGYHPNRPQDELTLPDDSFVTPRGGEYFFTPSLKGLREKFVEIEA